MIIYEFIQSQPDLIIDINNNIQRTTKEFLAWNMQTLILHLWSFRSECCELLLQPDGLHPGNAPAVHCTVGVSSLYISYSFLHQARGELESSWGVFKHEGWRRV